MTRVLVVDDDPMVRRLLTTVLTAQGITVVGEASDGDEVPAQVAAHRPDVVLMDLHMRRVGGIAAIEALHRTPHPPAVVALTSFGTDETVLAAVRAGAQGFLGKDDDPEQIAAHVRAVADGAGALGQDAAGALIRHLSGAAAEAAPREEARAALARLTERERAIAAWLPHGLSNPQIAARVYVSDSTVKSHLSSAMTKLGLSGREQLAVLVDRAGLAAPIP
ncbi:DNA-binding response regulator [Xylanimonas oleitrophica]|uniref:DNA-binding response regulator n=1 Tax=Xylanimonas oleitrophica TaxID=2607479 RepID=A0A2W5WV20_9MICO|nr:response regulator transcription factor [Xylanimonas oleitrophica]PZR55010.1 DNA-binding response regulator [Xylanimonas oleitrophica]